MPNRKGKKGKRFRSVRFLDVENHEQLEYMDWKIQVKRKHYNIHGEGSKR
jgi:hypothetical protein